MANAVGAISNLGKDRGWSVGVGDSTAFTDEVLSRYDAVVWLQSPGDALTAAQEAAYERFHRSGKGTIAVHQAGADPAERSWSWFRKLASSVRVGPPQVRTITVLNYDHNHPAACMLPMMWRHTDEWYRYAPSHAPGAHVLLYAWDPVFSNPVSWWQVVDGGRYFYTGLGGVAEDYKLGSPFLAHLAGGIEWAAGRAPNPVVRITDGPALIFREFDGVTPNGTWDRQPPSPDFRYEVTPAALTMLDSTAISLLNRHLVRRDVAIDARRPYAVEGRFSFPGPLDNKPHSFCINVNIAGPEGARNNVSCWSLNVHLVRRGKSMTRFMGFVDGGFAQIGQLENEWGEPGVEYAFQLYVNADLRGLHQDKLMSFIVKHGDDTLEKFQVDYSSFPYQPDESKPVRFGLNGHGTPWTLKDLRVYYLDVIAKDR